MKILVDIGHPGHVHYFRNLIKIMQKEGHEFLIIARDKEVTHTLLDYYKLNYRTRGKGKKGILGKLFYILYADYKIFKNARKFKPDLFLSFSSTYAGHVAFLLGKPHIVLDDTEHAKFEQIMYKPFSHTILTPKCFYKPMGSKQVKFNSYVEQCYLHKKYYTPDSSVLDLLKLKPDERYAIIRFVSWGASHDVGHSGFSSYNSKARLVEEISKKLRVFITSESELPEQLSKFKIQLPPERLHDALYFSTIYIGEGGTTASEAAILGVPTIYINSLPLMGYLKDEKEAGLLFHFNDEAGVLEKANEIIDLPGSRNIFRTKSAEMLEGTINPTDFLIWLINNYPSSRKIIMDNPFYQEKFI